MRRTTIAMDDAAFEAARNHAERCGVSLGRAISELVLRAAASPCPIVMDDGVPVLTPGPNASPMTDEDVRKALEEWP
jgi:hypothetical protein